MRKATILLAVVALALVVGGGVALAATMYGTNRHDAIFAKAGGDYVTGRERNDDLNGQGGNDRVLGGPGDDWVKGGDHKDTVRGDKGHDTITGGSGDNVIRAADGMRDLIICGNNSWNVVYYDRDLDRFKNCVFVESFKQSSIGGSSATITATGPGGEVK